MFVRWPKNTGFTVTPPPLPPLPLSQKETWGSCRDGLPASYICVSFRIFFLIKLRTGPSIPARLSLSFSLSLSHPTGPSLAPSLAPLILPHLPNRARLSDSLRFSSQCLNTGAINAGQREGAKEVGGSLGLGG